MAGCGLRNVLTKVMSLHFTMSANFSQFWLGLILPKSLDPQVEICCKEQFKVLFCQEK